MTVFFKCVDIFICQVHTAVVGYFSVDDKDLPVITVIVDGGKERGHGREHAALDPEFLHSLRVVVRQRRQFTGAVIHDADFYALCGFLRKNFEHLPPHFSFIDDKILEKDKFLGFLKIIQESLPFVFSELIVFDLRPGKDRVIAGLADVFAESCDIRSLPFEFVKDRRIFGQIFPVVFPARSEYFPQNNAAGVDLCINVEQRADDRNQRNHEQPCDFGRRAHLIIDQLKDDTEMKKDNESYELREPVGEFQQNTQEKSRTESEKKDDDSGAAENNAQNPLLSLVDKPQFFSFPTFHSNVPFHEKNSCVLCSEVYHNRQALPNLRRHTADLFPGHFILREMQ